MIHDYEAKYKFENGYGASVVRGQGTYGHQQGLFELAVMHGDGICYASPITDNVLGHLGKGEIPHFIKRIEDLPVNHMCTHKQAPEPEERMFEISVRYYTYDEDITGDDVSAIADGLLDDVLPLDGGRFEYLKVVG